MAPDINIRAQSVNGPVPINSDRGVSYSIDNLKQDLEANNVFKLENNNAAALKFIKDNLNTTTKRGEYLIDDTILDTIKRQLCAAIQEYPGINTDTKTKFSHPEAVKIGASLYGFLEIKLENDIADRRTLLVWQKSISEGHSGVGPTSRIRPEDITTIKPQQ